MVAYVPTIETMIYPVLTKPHVVNYLTLQTVTMQLFSNARSVPSFRGNGLLGHAFLVLGQVEYTARAGEPFLAPTNPGIPPVPAADATTRQMMIDAVNYKAAKEEWQTYTTTNSILMTQLIACIDEKYYASLIDRITGVSLFSLFEILTHLRNIYAPLTDDASLEAYWELDAAVVTTPSTNTNHGDIHGRGYCWTHGYGTNPNHTSCTCKNKAPGHRNDATLENMFGGNNTITRNRGEPAVYRAPPRPRRHRHHD